MRLLGAIELSFPFVSSIVGLSFVLLGACSGSIRSSSVNTDQTTDSSESAAAIESADAGSAGDGDNGNKPSIPNDAAGETSPGKEPELALEVRIEDFSNVTQELNLAPPAAIPLGPDGLRVAFEPVFGANPREGSTDGWFRGTTAPKRVAENPQLRFFTPDEYIQLGGILVGSIWSPDVAGFATATAVITERPTLSAQYMRALRSFLGDACRNLVRVEMLAGESSPDNRLFRGKDLNPTLTGAFFQALSGLNPDLPESDISSYISLFPKLLGEASATDPDDDALRVAYEHLCILLASDIRVISR